MPDIVTEFSIRRVYQMSDEYIQIGVDQADGG